jgi:hypothetical protein
MGYVSRSLAPGGSRRAALDGSRVSVPTAALSPCRHQPVEPEGTVLG